MSDIETAFHQEMLNIYDEATKAGYRPTYFRRMVNEHGGVEAAHRLVASENVTEGFARLWEMSRLDLTVEALILKPEYASLFTDEEREKARQRLETFNYLQSADAAPDSDSTPTLTANPPSMVERLAHAVANTQGGGEDEDEAVLEDADIIPDDDDLFDTERIEEADEGVITTSLEKWQQGITAKNPLVRRLTYEYPAWLQETFGERITLRFKSNSERLLVLFDSRIFQEFWFNKVWPLYVAIDDPAEEDVELLKQKLSKPQTFKWRRPNDRHSRTACRFFVRTDADYDLLKHITQRMIEQENHSISLTDVAYTDETMLEDAADSDEAIPVFEHLEEWQASIQADERIAWLVTEYPQWITDTFGDQVVFEPLENQRFRVLSKGKPIQRGRFNLRDGLYVWFPDLPADLRDEIRGRLSVPGSFQRSRRYGDWGHRFIVYTADDYHLLQEITEDMIHQPMTMAEAAYTILSRVGGGPLHLTTILEQAQEQGLIETSGQTPQLSLASALLRDGRFNNLGKNMWVLAPSGVGDEEHEDAPALPDYTPQMYAGSDVSFWRIYFDPKWWDEARDQGVIGLYYTTDTSVSVQRMKQIQAGDRVIAWTRGGYVRGIGVVTHPYTDIRETPDAPFSADLFGGEYPLLMGVRWSEELTEAVKVVPQLRAQAPDTYNRVIEHQRSVLPITHEDYATLLSLLRIDDIPDSIVPPVSLLDLHSYAAVVRQAGEQPIPAAELLERARATLDDLDPHTDADSFATLLRQLRLVVSDGAGTYQAQPYVVGNDTALLRLMALAYLHPASSDAETYTLPARAIVPRLRDPAVTSDTFAPALSPPSTPTPTLSSPPSR